MERNIISRIDKVLNRITSITSGVPAFVIGTLLVLWIIQIFIYVIARLVFSVKWLFVPEYTEYWMVCVVFLSFAYTLRSKGHIKIDIVVKHLSKRLKSILEATTTLVSLLITCFLVDRSIDWFLYALEINLHSTGPMYTVMWPIFIIVPIGLALLGLELALYFYRTVVEAVSGEGAGQKNPEKLGKV